MTIYEKKLKTKSDSKTFVLSFKASFYKGPGLGICFKYIWAWQYHILFKATFKDFNKWTTQEATCTLTFILFSPDGPRSTPQMIYPNMIGNPIVVHSQPHGKDNIPIVTIS